MAVVNRSVIYEQLGASDAHAVLTTAVHGVGASTIASAANIATHAALTTGVHGITVTNSNNVFAYTDGKGIILADRSIAGTVWIGRGDDGHLPDGTGYGTAIGFLKGANNYYGHIVLFMADSDLGNAERFRFTSRGNLLIGGTTEHATKGAGILSLFNGVAPGGVPADAITLISQDDAAAATRLSVWAESALVTEALVASTRSVPIIYNGTSLKLLAVLG